MHFLKLQLKHINPFAIAATFTLLRHLHLFILRAFAFLKTSEEKCEFVMRHEIDASRFPCSFRRKTLEY